MTDKVNGQVPATTTTPPAAAMMTVIEKAAMSKDVDVEKLERMLQMQERIMEKIAEIAFNEAMSRLQPDIPQIKKNKKSHNNTYATYEHVDKLVRPLYTKEGFSPSFNSSKQPDGTTTYYGILAHREGHSKQYEINLPDETSGSKNAVQARASAMSYAKRYLLQMMFNIVTTDEDDDGGAAGLQTITDKQAGELKKLIQDTGTDVKKILAMYGVKSIDELPAANYSGVKGILEAKKKGGAA